MRWRSQVHACNFYGGCLRAVSASVSPDSGLRAQTNFAQKSNSRRARIELPDSTKPGAGDVPFKIVQRKKPAGKPAAARIGRSTAQRSCGRTVAQDLCRGLGLARPGVETSLDAAARSACAPNAADLVVQMGLLFFGFFALLLALLHG